MRLRQNRDLNFGEPVSPFLRACLVMSACFCALVIDTLFSIRLKVESAHHAKSSILGLHQRHGVP